MRHQSLTASLLSAAGLLMASCGTDGGTQPTPGTTDGSAPDKRPPLVRVERVQITKVRREIETTGFLESEHRVMVLSKIAGRVVTVHTDDGQHVKAGDILANLDDSEAASAKTQVEIQIKDRKVRLKLAKLEVNAAARKVEQARIEEQQTKAELDRNLSMDPGLVSPKDLQDSKFAYAKAKEAHLVAKVEQGKAKLDVEVASQAVAELEAKLVETKVRIEDHKIRSPLHGVVAKRLIRGGETINASTELFDVVDPANLISYLKRPQGELAVVRKAKTVVFTTDSWPDREFTADVDLIGAVVDSATGSFEIRIRVRPDDSAVLLPGMFIRARILTEKKRLTAMVPKTAVLAEGEKSIVFVARGDKAVRLELQPGLETSTHVECRNRGIQGLRDDDLIIVGGQADLRDQDPIEVGKVAAGAKPDRSETDQPDADQPEDQQSQTAEKSK